MNIRIINTLLIFMAWSFTQTVCAQETMNPNWTAEKIRGVRFLPYRSYDGSPFLNDSWRLGNIEFADGEIADSLFLKYSSFMDELVYFNKGISTQIVIDKASLNGFSFVAEDGRTCVYRKQYFDGYMEGDRFFEVLSKGNPDLLVYRKVDLRTSSAYYDEGGVLKNMTYDSAYQYYFYSPVKGYAYVRINQGGFLAKFDKASQKQIKKLLRKNKIKITGEESFINAWKVVEKEGYEIAF